MITDTFWNILFLLSFVLFMTGIKLWTILPTEDSTFKLIIAALMTGIGLWGFVVSCQK